jgi:hypothetical protein
MSHKPHTLALSALAALTLLGAATANASAADVTVVSRDGKQKTFDIGALAPQYDVDQDYKLISNSGASRTVHVKGISVGALLQAADADPAYSRIVIAVPGQGSIRLTRTQIDSRDFAPPAVFETGGQAGFVRPSYATGDANASNFVQGASLTVNQPAPNTEDGAIVSATASKSKAKVKKSVTFTAKITNTAAGEQFTFKWNFDDGATATGETVKHAFKKAGTYGVLVSATPVGEKTSIPGIVKVTIGKAVKSDKQRAGNGTNDDAAAPATGSASGDSGSGDQAATEGATKNTKKKRKPEAKVDPNLEVVRGELIASTYTPIDPTQSTLAARSGQQQQPVDEAGFKLSGQTAAGIAALLLLGGGAFLELRGVPSALRRRPASA